MFILLSFIIPFSSQDWKPRLKIPSPDTCYKTEVKGSGRAQHASKRSVLTRSTRSMACRAAENPCPEILSRQIDIWDSEYSVEARYKSTETWSPGRFVRTNRKLRFWE